MPRNAVPLLAAALLSAAACTALRPEPGATATDSVPWWDNFPTLVQTGDAAQAARAHATAALCGAADDPAWGVWGQQLRVVQSGTRTTAALHAQGIRALSWVEGFGNPSCYVVQLKRNPDGSWMKADGTDITRAFCNAWGWKVFDGTGEVRWVGIHTYFDDIDYARPYTRFHPRYGAPPMAYPDGRVATGYDGPSTDPRCSRVFDAGCGKDVLGRMWGVDRGEPLITDVLRGGAAPTAAAGSAAAAADAPTVVPDPGYTPAEWAERTRRSGALLRFEADKDAACPVWADYARAEVRVALDTGVDGGLWVDNFSPWDSLNASPVHHAFGEWSVARFRDHLRRQFPAPALAAMGVADLARFDVRQYLQAKVRDWGGDPGNLKDPRWADTRWTDDPVWRAYLIHKRRTGTEALSRLYGVLKEEAARAGQPEFAVLGNDIPAFSLGWPRGDLDMVSTELTWGWWLATGPRGIMPPPLGCYVPVYRLAREHARSRFVNLWMYAAKEAVGKPNTADVLYYQGLAAHALPMPQFGDKTVGNEDRHAAFFAFVRAAAPVFGRRLPVEEAGVYYSSSSQLVDLLPAWYRDHANQRHSFSFWGWGTALTWLHVPWRAVPEWKLTPATLAGLRLLVIPSAEVFPAADVPVLEHWVRDGGTLIVSGDCGGRDGEDANFEPAAGGSTLAPRLVGGPAAASGPHPLGRGRVLCLADDPGLPFYRADTDRPARLPAFAAHLATAGTPPDSFALATDSVPWQTGVTLYRDADRLFVDVNNTNLDLATDTVTPAPATTLVVRLPPALRGHRLRARVLSPDTPAPAADLADLDADRVRVTLGPLRLYASVVLERL